MLDYILGQGGSQHLRYPEPLADIGDQWNESDEFNFPFLLPAENKVLTYFYCKKYPYKKIAQIMRRKQNAVKQLKYRALTKIRVTKKPVVERVFF